MRCRSGVVLAALSVLVVTVQAPAAEGETIDGLETAEVRAVAALLAENPAGFGRPIGDRGAWGRLAKTRAFRSAVREAEGLLAKPLPDQPDDLYLEFSRNGNRSRWQRVAGQRRGRISDLTIAECLENKGRFLPPLEETIRALCAERTWVMPAHDGKLDNFKGEAVTIDLGSSGLAALPFGSAFRLEASCTYTPEIPLVGGTAVTIRVSHWGIVERFP